MNKILILIGGIQQILGLIFHMLFWKLFRWPEDLLCLSYDNRAGMQVLDLQLMLIFAFFAYVSFFKSNELLTTSIGRMIGWFIIIFYFARVINQFLFWDPLMKAATFGLLGQKEQGEKCIEKLLKLRPDFPSKGKALIRNYIKFEEIALRIEEGLHSCGLRV